MYQSITIMLVLISSFTFSMNAAACDNKACEIAYLAETKQHIDNQIPHANAFKAERHAYSKIRERRAYAHYVHMHFMLFRSEPSKNI